jgi:ketosteroid isomerase-like protein
MKRAGTSQRRVLMKRSKTVFIFAGIALTALRPVALAFDDATIEAPEIATEEVRRTEIAFAKTMEERDFEAFQTFLADEAIFYNGDQEIRGKEAVAAAWKRLFEGAEAPFSWRPEVVSTLDSGSLGLSSGPIFNPDGKRVGTFNSIWRRGSDGTWQIVFDRGCTCG